jgi:hypothetical protein
MRLNPKYITGIVILFGLILLLMFQIFAITTGYVSTISVFAEELDSVNPLVSHMVTAIFSILIGHWFIPPSRRK